MISGFQLLEVLTLMSSLKASHRHRLFYFLSYDSLVQRLVSIIMAAGTNEC